MIDEFQRWLVAYVGIVLVVIYLSQCTPLYGSPTGFRYERRPLVVWGHWAGTHYAKERWWVRTVYAIK